MKKLLALFLSLALITLLTAACASVDPAPVATAPAPAPEAPAPAPEPDAPAPAPEPEPGQSNLEASLALNIDNVIGSDGQPILLTLTGKEIPPRPDDPSTLPETDPLHWYDMEFAGWGAQNKTVPDSPADGSIGKHAIVIINGDHPYLTAYSNGAKIAADALGMTVDILSPNWDLNVQNQQVDQAINAHPDVIILITLDPNAGVQQFRRINEAGIPVISSNMLPDAEAMQYVLTWSGPDDFGQMAMLARAAGAAVNGEGGVAYMTHNPGGSPYFARYNRYEAELAVNYPNIKTLDVQSPGFEADRARQVAADWITRFGDELKIIQLADDAAQGIGAIEAVRAAGRDDIIITAAGNSKVGMDGILSGDMYGITYQSAEGDGAIAIKLAADWFNGKTLDPMYYLPQHVITAADVNDFMPAQW